MARLSLPAWPSAQHGLTPTQICSENCKARFLGMNFADRWAETRLAASAWTQGPWEWGIGSDWGNWSLVLLHPLTISGLEHLLCKHYSTRLQSLFLPKVSLLFHSSPWMFLIFIYSFMHLLRCWESNSGHCTRSQVIVTALWSHLLSFRIISQGQPRLSFSTKSSCLCLSSARIAVIHCHEASHSALQTCPLWQSPQEQPFPALWGNAL